MKPIILAANWKMHLGPADAREFMRRFLLSHRRTAGKEVWFFPAALAVEAVADAVADRSDIVVGVQHIHWEAAGAFTGEISAPMARATGSTHVLDGHSERRHVFGETIDATARKVRAALEADLIPILCVGETLEQREAGETLTVVARQLAALDGVDPGGLGRVVVAYEPVWAIGTGRTATVDDAAEVHTSIRAWLAQRGVSARDARVLYGGSVKPANAEVLMASDQIDGVLVGGASLDPTSWSEVCAAGSID